MLKDPEDGKKILKKLSSKQIKRQELIYELVQTEKGYLRHLNVFSQVFKRGLMSEHVVGMETSLELFGNIEGLIDMHRPIAALLQTTLEEHATEPLVNVAEKLLVEFDKIDPQQCVVSCSN